MDPSFDDMEEDNDRDDFVIQEDIPSFENFVQDFSEIATPVVARCGGIHDKRTALAHQLDTPKDGMSNMQNIILRLRTTNVKYFSRLEAEGSIDPNELECIQAVLAFGVVAVLALALHRITRRGGWRHHGQTFSMAESEFLTKVLNHQPSEYHDNEDNDFSGNSSNDDDNDNDKVDDDDDDDDDDDGGEDDVWISLRDSEPSLPLRSLDRLSELRRTTQFNDVDNPQREASDLINRSRILDSTVTPQLSPSQMTPNSPPSDTSAVELSRLSDEMSDVGDSVFTGMPSTQTEYVTNIGPYTLDSANLLDVEAITANGLAVQDNQNDTSNVNVILRVTKKSKSTDIAVSARPNRVVHGPSRSIDLLDFGANTTELESCESELPPSLGFQTNDLFECPESYSLSSLVKCDTETDTPVPFPITTPTPQPEQKLGILHQVDQNIHYCRTTTPEPATSKLEDCSNYNDTEFENGSITAENTNEVRPVISTVSCTKPEHFAAQRTTTRRTPVVESVGGTISRIPVRSPLKDQTLNLINLSPIPRFKIQERASLSRAVDDHFFKISSDNDGEAFLGEVFGDDPYIAVSANALDHITDTDFVRCLDVFVGKETSQNWSLRFDALDTLIGHIRLRKPDDSYEHLQKLISERLEDILLLVNTTRSKLLGKVVVFVRDLVFFGSDIAQSNENYAVLLHLLIPLTRTSQASRHIQNLATKSLCLMLQAITTASLLENFDLIFKCILKEKKMKGEKYACLVMIKFYILYNRYKMNQSDRVAIIDLIIPFVPELCIDPYQKTRAEVLELFLIFDRLDGYSPELKHYYDSLGTFLRSQVPTPEGGGC